MAIEQAISEMNNGRCEDSESSAATGGPSILGPVKYPFCPKPLGGENRTGLQMHASSSIGPGVGGMPPGLRLPPPPRPADQEKSNRQVIREKDPLPMITSEEFGVVRRSLDIWARLENPGENPQVADEIFFGENSTKYARQGKLHA